MFLFFFVQGDTPNKGRKKIRHVIGEEELEEGTKEAAKEEEERLKRIASRQKMVGEISFISVIICFHAHLITLYLYFESLSSMMRCMKLCRKDLMFWRS